MSYAITALILLRLQDAPGLWVSVDELARFMVLPVGQVRLELGFLEAAGDVEVQRGAADLVEAARLPAAVGAPKAAAPPLPYASHLERFERPSRASAGRFHRHGDPA